MKSLLRCRLIAVAALTMYLVVHVFASALHHHGTEAGSSALETTCEGDSQRSTASSTAIEEDGEETCLLCAVLHLAQCLPTATSLQAVASLDDDVICALRIRSPYPLKFSTHSRAPPMI